MSGGVEIALVLLLALVLVLVLVLVLSEAVLVIDRSIALGVRLGNTTECHRHIVLNFDALKDSQYVVDREQNRE